MFFDGAMSVLQPKIDDGTLKVLSGQTEVAQTATQGWAAEEAQSRMDTLLSGFYQGDVPIDGVLAPNDNLARAIIESARAAGKALPVVTGQDSEVESVKSIMAGEQYMTIYKDTRALVAASIDDGARSSRRARSPARSMTPSRTTTASRSSRPTCFPRSS